MARTRDISELVSRAQNGDRESLGVLSARVRRRMFIYLYRMTLDYHLAEDLVQETVLYMIESLPRLETASSLSLWAWIYRSAWGILRHYVRPQGHQRIVQKTVVDHEALLHLTDGNKDTALEHAERSELFEAVCKSLGTLRAKHRNVLVLRCFEQLSHAEIASVMGCSELKARVLFFHAKHALKRQLHNRGFGRRYFLTGVSLFGLITTTRATSTSAAVTVTSSLSKTRTLATTVGAATAKLGLMKTAVAATVLVAAAIHVCSSDADVPRESPVSIVPGGGKNIFSAPGKMDNAKVADLLPTKGDTDRALPDPCGYEPHVPEGMPPPIAGGSPQPTMPAAIAESAARVDLFADPNEIRAGIGSFAGLAEVIRDTVASSAIEHRYWQQSMYDNRTSLARAIQKQVEEELALLRNVAVEDKATKTIEAIDNLVAERKTRYSKVNKELLQQRKKASVGQSSRSGRRARASAKTSGRSYSPDYSPNGDTGDIATAATRRHGRPNAGAEDPTDRETQDEIRRWLQTTADNKLDLARATHDRTSSEMALIRSVATEEDAGRTMAAIDGLLLQRKERLDELIKKSREEAGDGDQSMQIGGRTRGRTRAVRVVQTVAHQGHIPSDGRRRR